MSDVTTTLTGFKNVDITFKGARRQSEIDRELGREEESTRNISIPVSLTPEQVKSFFNKLSDSTMNTQEKKIYKQAISWIDELAVVKKKLYNLESKMVVENDDASAEDIEE